jgi:hypothetical protein
VSDFPSISIPNIPTPIPLVVMLKSRFYSSGGPSLGFSTGGGIPSTSTIPISILVMSSVGFPFSWNIPSGFGIVPTQSRGSIFSGVLISHGVAHYLMGSQFLPCIPLFQGENPLGENLCNGLVILSSIHLVPGVFPKASFVWEVIFL